MSLFSILIMLSITVVLTTLFLGYIENKCPYCGKQMKAWNSKKDYCDNPKCESNKRK